MTTQLHVLLKIIGRKEYIALSRNVAAIVLPPTGTMINFSGDSAEVYEAHLGFVDGELQAKIYAMREYGDFLAAEAAGQQAELAGWSVKRPS